MCPDTRAPPVASAPLPWPRAVALWDPMPGSDHRGAALGMERARWATPPAAGRRGRRGPGPRGTGGPATLGPPASVLAPSAPSCPPAPRPPRRAARRGQPRALSAGACPGSPATPPPATAGPPIGRRAADPPQGIGWPGGWRLAGIGCLLNRGQPPWREKCSR